MISSEELRKYIFMNYKEVLQYFEKNSIKTKYGKEITHKDLRTAILIMNEKHSLCRWQSEKFRKRYYYLQYEGVIWLRDVYFDNYQIKFIDRDVQWFEERILWYQNTLSKNNIEYPIMDFQLKPMTKKNWQNSLNGMYQPSKKQLSKWRNKQITKPEIIITEYCISAKNKYCGS